MTPDNIEALVERLKEGAVEQQEAQAGCRPEVLIEAAQALTFYMEEVARLREATQLALMLIESSEFADTACLDPEGIAQQLRSALSHTSLDGGGRG